MSPARTALGLAFTANFLHTITMHMPVHLAGFLQAEGLSESRIGWAMATLAGVAIVSRPLIGSSVDRRSRRRVASAGGALHVIAALTYVLATYQPGWIYLARAIHGLAQGILFTVLFTIAMDWVPPQRQSQGLAIFGISGMVALSFAAWLGDLILHQGSYRQLFLVAALCAFLGILATLGIPEAPHRRESFAGAGRSYFSVVWRPGLRPVWLIGLGYALAISPLFIFLKTYLLEQGQEKVGTFFVAYSMTAVLLRVLLGWMPDRFGLWRILLPALLSTTSGLLLVAATTQPALLAGAGALCGLGHGFIFPILLTLVARRSPADERGRGVSLFTGLFDVGQLVGGPLLGWTIEYSDYPTMFVSCGGMLIACTFAFLLWEQWLRKHGQGGDVVAEPR